MSLFLQRSVINTRFVSTVEAIRSEEFVSEESENGLLSISSLLEASQGIHSLSWQSNPDDDAFSMNPISA